MAIMSSNVLGKVENMGSVTYSVKVPELAAALDLGAMDLVRYCGIAVGTAYKAVDKCKSSGVSLDSCWMIYKGLRENGIKINGNDIQWSDVVEFSE